MRQGLISLLLGLLGGVGGALGYGTLAGGDGAPGDEVAGTGAQTDLSALLRRIEDLEARWDEAEGGARLEGRPDAEPAGQRPPEWTEPEVARLEARLLERLEPRLDEAMEEKWEELSSEGDEEGEERGGRKRMPLADVAREIGLSGGEEDELRRIYDETTQKYLELFAKPDGDVEQVKRDFETFQNDETARAGLMAKYLPKLVGGIGEMMTIEAEKERRIRETLGPEKAAELAAYEVVEERPFGMQTAIGVSARAER